MTPDPVSKDVMLENLKSLLSDVFKLRREGAAYPRLARAHGYVDGYMRVLLESGLVSRKELLDLVAAERVRADGPATGTVESEVAA